MAPAPIFRPLSQENEFATADRPVRPEVTARQRDALSRRQRHVVVAPRADVVVRAELLAVDDLAAGLALRPEPLGARGPGVLPLRRLGLSLSLKPRHEAPPIADLAGRHKHSAGLDRDDQGLDHEDQALIREDQALIREDQALIREDQALLIAIEPLICVIEPELMT